MVRFLLLGLVVLGVYGTAHGGDARPLRILLGGGGSVRMCDPAVAAGDTRAC